MTTIRYLAPAPAEYDLGQLAEAVGALAANIVDLGHPEADPVDGLPPGLYVAAYFDEDDAPELAAWLELVAGHVPVPPPPPPLTQAEENALLKAKIQTLQAVDSSMLDDLYTLYEMLFPI